MIWTLLVGIAVGFVLLAILCFLLYSAYLAGYKKAEQDMFGEPAKDVTPTSRRDLQA